MSSVGLAPSRPIALEIAYGRTLADLVPAFLKWFQFVCRRSDNTVRAYADDFKAFLGFCAAAKLERPEQVTFRHIEFYLGWLQKERGVKPQSANRHLHALRSLYRYLVREEIVTTNPAADCFMLPTRKKLPGYLTVPEQEKCLAALAEDRPFLGRRDYALVATGLFTGLRSAELAALELAHVNLEAGRLRVVNGKGSKDRELLVVPRLAAILREYLAEIRPALVGRPLIRVPAAVPFVFVNAHPTGSHRLRRAGQALHGRSIWHLIHRAVVPVIGRPVHPHMLRHSFASRLRENGAGLQVIQEALGHANTIRPRCTRTSPRTAGGKSWRGCWSRRRAYGHPPIAHRSRRVLLPVRYRRVRYRRVLVGAMGPRVRQRGMDSARQLRDRGKVPSGVT